MSSGNNRSRRDADNRAQLLLSHVSSCPSNLDPGVAHTTSHQAGGRVLKYLTGALGQERQLCAHVCGKQGLLGEQGERARLLQLGNNKWLLCEAINSAIIDRTSFLYQGPWSPSPVPSALWGPKRWGGICTSINRGPELPHRWHQCTNTAVSPQKSSRAVLKISSFSALSRK